MSNNRRGGVAMMEVFAACAPRRRPRGPALRAVGQARINRDGTITVWLDALPTEGVLLMRKSPEAAQPEARPDSAEFADHTAVTH